MEAYKFAQLDPKEGNDKNESLSVFFLQTIRTRYKMAHANGNRKLALNTDLWSSRK